MLLHNAYYYNDEAERFGIIEETIHSIDRDKLDDIIEKICQPKDEADLKTAFNDYFYWAERTSHDLSRDLVFTLLNMMLQYAPDQFKQIIIETLKEEVTSNQMFGDEEGGLAEALDIPIICAEDFEDWEMTREEILQVIPNFYEGEQ